MVQKITMNGWVVFALQRELESGSVLAMMCGDGYGYSKFVDAD